MKYMTVGFVFGALTDSLQTTNNEPIKDPFNVSQGGDAVDGGCEIWTFEKENVKKRGYVSI